MYRTPLPWNHKYDLTVFAIFPWQLELGKGFNIHVQIPGQQYVFT